MVTWGVDETTPLQKREDAFISLVNDFFDPDFQTARQLLEARKFRSSALVTPKLTASEQYRAKLQSEAVLRGTAKAISNLLVARDTFASVREVHSTARFISQKDGHYGTD